MILNIHPAVDNAGDLEWLDVLLWIIAGLSRRSHQHRKGADFGVDSSVLYHGFAYACF